MLCAIGNGVSKETVETDRIPSETPGFSQQFTAVKPKTEADSTDLQKRLIYGFTIYLKWVPGVALITIK